MNVMKQFEAILDYIEDHLTSTIKETEIAKIAGCSFSTFQRMFSYIVGISLSAYIRNRKMSCAAFDLLNHQKIIDVSMKYGYQSPTSFNRSFQTIHGFPPSQTNTRRKELHVYPRIHLSISVSGDTSIRYRIEEKKTLYFYTKKYLLSDNMESNFQNVPLFWNDFLQNQSIQEILPYKKEEDRFLYGIILYQQEIPIEYHVGVLTTVADTKSTLAIPKHTWLVLQGMGKMPEAMQKMYRKFYQEWLPASKYQYCYTGDIEVYPLYTSMKEENDFELWIPINQRKK